MTTHRVKANFQVIELTKRTSAVNFEIFSGRNKIGDIEIGKGSFGWKAPGKQIYQTEDWTTFCKFLDQHFNKG